MEQYSPEGLSLILPFLTPIEHLVLDDTLSEIMVNPNGNIYIERAGTKEYVDNLLFPQKKLRSACISIAASLNQRVSHLDPIFEGHLGDGSRVTIVFPPASPDGITLDIRKFPKFWPSLDELTERGSVAKEVSALLEAAIRDRKTILFSGEPKAGKSTLMAAVVALIDPNERVALIEDTAELQVNLPHMFRLVARKKPILSQTLLLQTSLRLAFDRLLVGEVRGGEANDLLEALNVGTRGCLCTLHANSAFDALARFRSLVLLSQTGKPFAAIQEDIANGIDLVVHVSKTGSFRHVSEVMQLNGFNSERGTWLTESLYRR